MAASPACAGRDLWAASSALFLFPLHELLKSPSLLMPSRQCGNQLKMSSCWSKGHNPPGCLTPLFNRKPGKSSQRCSWTQEEQKLLQMKQIPRLLWLQKQESTWNESNDRKHDRKQSDPNICRRCRSATHHGFWEAQNWEQGDCQQSSLKVLWPAKESCSFSFNAT